MEDWKEKIIKIEEHRRKEEFNDLFNDEQDDEQNEDVVADGVMFMAISQFILALTLIIELWRLISLRLNGVVNNFELAAHLVGIVLLAAVCFIHKRFLIESITKLFKNE